MPGTDLVGSANWAMYKQLMRDAQETFGKKTITWKKMVSGLDRFGEDNPTSTFNTITLEVLLQYNVFRTWPLDANSDLGKVDKESVMVIINREYLEENNWLTANGNLAFDAGKDRFIIDGITYKCDGFTDTSQDQTDPLWTSLILLRDKEITAVPNP